MIFYYLRKRNRRTVKNVLIYSLLIIKKYNTTVALSKFFKMKKRPHFKALITYNKTEDGGIVTPVSSGFRASFIFPFENRMYIASQTFPEAELVFPGDVINAEITLIGDDMLNDKLYEGMDFEVADQSGTIGSGVITTVYPGQVK